MNSSDINVETMVKEVVGTIFKKDPSKISNDTRYAEDLSARSINYIQLVAVLEDRFKIKVPAAASRKIKTVGETVKMIESILQ